MTSDGGESRAVCVTVDGSRKILNGLSWRTTAGDVIQALRPRAAVPQVLVESWRGCLRPIGEEEFVCQILEEWGEEARDVSLILMSAHSLPGCRIVRRGLDAAKIYGAQRHGKVSANKRRCVSRVARPRRELGKEIARLIARAQVARERLDEVQALEKRLEDATFSECPSMELSPSEEEEWMSLQEQLTEEEKEGRELEERRREILDNIETQSGEITQVKRRNTDLQRKLLQEEEKRKRLSGGERSRELEEAQAQVERLRNELNVRQKLNKMQSNKLQEVSASIADLEQEDCTV